MPNTRFVYARPASLRMLKSQWPVMLLNVKSCSMLFNRPAYRCLLHIQQPLIQTIVNALSQQGTCPSTGASALRTARVMDMVLDRYYGGRADAFWRRPATWVKHIN